MGKKNKSVMKVNASAPLALLGTAAVLLVAYLAVPAEGFSAPQLIGYGRSAGALQCGKAQKARQANVPALRMKEDGDATKLAKGLGQALGGGFAGLTKSLDDFGAELDKEEAASGMAAVEKKGFFEGREERMKAGMEKDLLGEEGGELAVEDEVPCPAPILLSEEDFTNSIWKVQVEKNGNWFSGNYVPTEFTMAISNKDNQTCEYAGERLTKGKWYIDGSSFYFERKPLGFLGPINPGQEYFRASLQGWTNDENTGDKLQVAGYVSGYSPLFPTAILGRFLMTKVKAISQEELKERRAYTNKVLFPELNKPKLQEAKSMALDLTDDLSEEERLRVEAAEWVPSTITSVKKKQEDSDAIEDKLGSAFERIKKTVQDTDSFKELAEDIKKRTDSDTLNR